MNVERALIERIGDVGRKLHTGRSRNDQISNDIRLWVRDEIDAMSTRLELVQRAFLGRAETDAGVVLPAYTHLQRAQPVLAAHYWLAYCEKLERDRDRLADCRLRVNQMSLGSAALAGTSIPIDRHMVAEELEFDGILANSLDGSSDRDFVLEFAFCLASIATHLSGWAEEWILWSTTEFSFLRLPQEFCTGSSIMPQKINPDVLELIRGKTGRVVGNLMSSADAPERPAASLQPRPARRQRAALRFGRHGRRLPRPGRPDRRRRRAESRTRSPPASTKATSTPPRSWNTSS